MKSLNKGDKVELLFGGPVMIVSESNLGWDENNNSGSPQEVLCHWKFKGEQIQQTFARLLLNKLNQ